MDSVTSVSHFFINITCFKHCLVLDFVVGWIGDANTLVANVQASLGVSSR